MTTWTARDILDSIEEGKFRLDQAKAEAEAEAQRRLDEETASNSTAWEPVIARIKQSIPEWAWQYLCHPNRKPTFRSEHVTMIVPATIDLEGMGLVFAYVADHRTPNDPPLFVPAEWYLQDDDESWSVCLLNGRSETVYSVPGHPDFLIALAQAYATMEHYAGMKAEADRRNAERQAKVTETPEPAFDWLHKARWALGAAKSDGNEAAIAYALIGILEQLQKVTTPLYGGSQHAIQTFDNSRGQL